jgi:hypothetical protein
MEPHSKHLKNTPIWGVSRPPLALLKQMEALPLKQIEASPLKQIEASPLKQIDPTATA